MLKELMSGLPARDDGYARKAGFRYDKSLNSDLDFTFAGGFATRRVEHIWIYPPGCCFPLDPAFTSFCPCLGCNTNGSPGIPDPVLHYPTWPDSNGFYQPYWYNSSY